MAPTPQSRSQGLINVKLLLIGNSSVGKSSLLLRFSDKQWLPEDEASATIGVDFRVRSQPPSLISFFFNIIDVAFVCCGNTISGTQAGGSGTEGQDEYMGASLCFLPLARKGRTLRCFSCAFFGTRTLQAKNGFELSPHHITAERRASYSVRLFHHATFLPSCLTRIPVLACACAPARVQ